MPRAAGRAGSVSLQIGYTIPSRVLRFRDPGAPMGANMGAGTDRPRAAHAGERRQ